MDNGMKCNTAPPTLSKVFDFNSNLPEEDERKNSYSHQYQDKVKSRRRKDAPDSDYLSLSLKYLLFVQGWSLQIHFHPYTV